VPAYTTLYRFLRRLDAVVLEQALSEASRCLLPTRGNRRATVAVNATGLTPGAMSTFFVKRVKDQEPGFTWRQSWKWTMAVDVERRLISAQAARQGPTNDCATLHPSVDAAHQCDGERNHQHSRSALRAHSRIPAKRGRADWRVKAIRAQRRQDFPRHAYGLRSLIESVISAVKRKPSARASGRSIHTQCLQALLLGVAYHIDRL